MYKDKFYRLEIIIEIQDENEESEYLYFLNESDAIKYRDMHYKSYHDKDDLLIRGYDYIDYDILELTFDEMKKEISVDQFEKLFDINVKQNMRGAIVLVNS